MADDRVAVLEQRVAALEREVAALRDAGNGGRPPARRHPLDGPPLIAKKRSPAEAAEYEARRLKELGIDHLQPVGAQNLRQMIIDAGVDPNTTEFSRGIIEMREE